MRNFPKWMMLVFLVLLVGLLAALIWFYQFEKQALHLKVYRNLDTISQLKTGQIEEWRRERIADVLTLTRLPSLLDNLEALMTGKPDEASRSLAAYFDTFRAAYQYADIFLVDTNGDIRVDFFPASGHDLPQSQEIRAALGSRQPALLDVLGCPDDPAFHLLCVAPLYAGQDPSGPVVAGVVTLIDPKVFLYPLIQTWPVPTASAETLLVRRVGEEVVYLNDLRHRRGTALTLRFPLAHAELPAVQTLRGKPGLLTGPDYRGMPVLAVGRPVPGSPWFMVSKIDASEARADWQFRSTLLLSVMALLAVLAAVLSLLLWQHAQKERVRHLYEAASVQRATEMRYGTILKSIGDAVIVTDGEGRIQLLNPVAETLTGYREAEACGLPLPEVFRIIRQEGRTPAPNPVERVLREGTVVGLANHTSLIDKHGGERPIADSAAPIRDEQGKVTGVVLVFRDQTAEQDARKALEDSFERLKEAQRAAQIGSWESDRLRDKVWWSDQMYRLAELDPDQMPNPTRDFFWKQLLHPEDAPVVSARYEEAIARKEPFSFRARLRMPDGRIKHIEMLGRAVYAPDGTAIRTRGTMQDISGRVLAEEALRLSEQRYRLLAENSGDVIWLLDIHTFRFVYVSPSVEKLLGYSVDEVLQQTPLEVMTEDSCRLIEERLPPRLASFAAGDSSVRSQTMEITQKHRDGRLIPTEVTTTLLTDDQGRVTHVLGISRDISERKRAEAEKDKLEARLAQTQKLESIGRLAGGVAHDFNNHLQAILGFTELIMEGMDPTRHEYADLLEIQKAARYSADLTRQLLAFSRQQLTTPVRLDLNHVLADMLRMIQRLVGEGVELAWKPSVKVHPVRMDVTQVNQILVNLCVNARDAMKGTGRIEIETLNITCDEAFCSTRPDAVPGAYVLLRVRDTGCGMTPDVLQHLFEPFYTTKAFGQSTGLGLATVHGIVRQNNGFIEVESQPGAGATFSIYLPACMQEGTTPADAASEAEPAGKLPRGRGETVVILDDQGAVLQIAERLLARLGYQVLAARNAAEVLSLMRSRKEAIHLLLTDVIMPDLSGRELARQVAVLRPEVKCLFMSGFTADELVRDGALAPETSLLQKPFSGETLALHIRQVLDG